VRQSPRSKTPQPVRARSLLRETLLDAARELLRGRPWAKISMAQVAQSAGVSRGTLYREFDSRTQFQRELVKRESDRHRAALERAISKNRANPADALRATFAVLLDAATENPLLANILGGQPDQAPARVSFHGQPLLASATTSLQTVLLDAWPELAPPDGDLLSEALVRLAISHVAMPQTFTMTTESVGAMLGPYLDRALRTSADRGAPSTSTPSSAGH